MQRGFTLKELIILCLILGSLMPITAVSFCMRYMPNGRHKDAPTNPYLNVGASLWRPYHSAHTIGKRYMVSISKNERAKMVSCKANLDRMGKSMKIYLLDYGRNVLYPQRSGAGCTIH